MADESTEVPVQELNIYAAQLMNIKPIIVGADIWYKPSDSEPAPPLVRWNPCHNSSQAMMLGRRMVEEDSTATYSMGESKKGSYGIYQHQLESGDCPQYIRSAEQIGLASLMLTMAICDAFGWKE